MTDAQMKLLLRCVVLAFVACGVGAFYRPALPFVLGFAAGTFIFYVGSVLLRAGNR